MATPLLGKFLGVMSGLSMGTRVSNFKSVALTVLELLAFNSHDRPLRAHTHKHTSNERIISAIHFVHLAEITINIITITIDKQNKPQYLRTIRTRTVVRMYGFSHKLLPGPPENSLTPIHKIHHLNSRYSSNYFMPVA